VTGGTLAVDQPLIAQVTVVDDRIRVLGIAGGQATLTLTRDGLSAEAMVTVLASGAVMPEGTALWESAPLGEPSVKRGQVLRANRADDGSSLSADLFFVDEGTEGAGRYIYRLNNRPTVIRAMTFDGQELWSRSFAGEAMIKDLAADARGGLLLVLKATYDTDGLPQRVQRIDGATGAVSWEYFAPDDGDLSEVAVHPDGTVFVSTEGYYYPDVTYLVGLDGETGAVRQWRLPNGSSPTGPVVRDDGSVVVLFNPADDEGRHLQLATLNTGSSAPAFSDLYLATPKRWLYPYQYRLIPHGDALLLARKEYGTDVIRISPDGVMGPPTTLLTPDVPVAQVEYAVAGGTGMALIKRQTGEYDRPYNVYKASFDPVTLALSGVVPFGTDPYLTPRFITSEGTVYISGEMFGSNDTQVVPGLWGGLSGTAWLSLGPEVDSDLSSSYLAGGSDSTNATRLRLDTTLEAAAVRFLNDNLVPSQLLSREVGARVCEVKKNSSTLGFAYGRRVLGPPCRAIDWGHEDEVKCVVNPTPSLCVPIPGTSITYVAEAHTHPFGDDPGNSASGGDQLRIKSLFDNGMYGTGYLANSYGIVWYYGYTGEPLNGVWDQHYVPDPGSTSEPRQPVRVRTLRK
jgi:hypothetical protein